MAGWRACATAGQPAAPHPPASGWQGGAAWRQRGGCAGPAPEWSWPGRRRRAAAAAGTPAPRQRPAPTRPFAPDQCSPRVGQAVGARHALAAAGARHGRSCRSAAAQHRGWHLAGHFDSAREGHAPALGLLVGSLQQWRLRAHRRGSAALDSRRLMLWSLWEACVSGPGCSRHAPQDLRARPACSTRSRLLRERPTGPQGLRNISGRRLGPRLGRRTLQAAPRRPGRWAGRRRLARPRGGLCCICGLAQQQQRPPCSVNARAVGHCDDRYGPVRRDQRGALETRDAARHVERPLQNRLPLLGLHSKRGWGAAGARRAP